MSVVSYYFMLFIFYSFIGWLIEVIGAAYNTKKFVDRGFLIGPYCPIYGFSGLFIILTLERYINDPVVLFIIIVVVASIIEYTTSYLMEKIFKARWWDYYHMTFNINGRICLEFSVLFGVLGLACVYLVNPFLSNFLIDNQGIFLSILSYTLLFLFILDVFISLNVVSRIQLTAEAIKRDYTEEITEKVKEILFKKSYLARRLLKAFPHFKPLNIKIKIRK